jgi:hypothetical protein
MSTTINLPALPPVSLASKMLFKPLFTAVLFALSAAAHPRVEHVRTLSLRLSSLFTLHLEYILRQE